MRFIYTKGFAIFVICLVIVCGLIFFEIKGFFDPVRNGLLQTPRPAVLLVKKITLPVENFFSTIYRLHNILKENIVLKQQNQQLMLNSAQLSQYQVENDALRKELGFAKKTKMNLQPCTVLSENPTGLSNTLVLGCGTGQGINAGQAVLSQGFLVGKIVYVSHEFSYALLLNSPQFSTDAKVSNTGVTGVVKGSFGSGFILDELPQTAELQKDWLVVTGGINIQIPKDIVIGQVVDIYSKSNDLFKKATLSSPIDLDTLDFVFVAK